MPKSKLTKRVVLLIVEGPSDEYSLAAVMKKLIVCECVAFEVVHGDILADKDTHETNILNKICELIYHLTGERKFCAPKDISRVVHLIDTDGVFISPDCVIENPAYSIRYTLEGIEAQSVGLIKDRNLRKSRIAKKLIGNKTITCEKHPIPYKIYFFSRNLEHVLHDRFEELSDIEKQQLSEDFEDLYADDPDGFLKLICAPGIGADGDYRTSWDTISEGTNSLKRKTNLNIFFDEYFNKKDDSR